MRRVPFLAGVLWALSASGLVEAQSLEDFATFGLHNPEHSGAIAISGDMDSGPEGSYSVTGSYDTSARQTWTFLVTGCEELTAAEVLRLRAENPAQTFRRCAVTEVMNLWTPGTSTDPGSPIDWGRVVFSRYRSAIVGSSDFWCATLTLRHRRVQLFIGQEVFVFQNGSTTHPSVHVIEARVIRVPADTGR